MASLNMSFWGKVATLPDQEDSEYLNELAP